MFDISQKFPSDCNHKTFTTSLKRVNCSKCGMHISQFGAKTFRSGDMEFRTQFCVSDIYNSFFKRKLKRVKFKAKEYKQKRERMIDQMYSFSKVFNITKNTA